MTRNVVSAPAGSDWAAVSWLRSRSGAVAIALVVLASARIIATYHVYDHTSDEPVHIACGMERLVRGYILEAQHPPLARVAAALGPYLAGARSPIFDQPDYTFAREHIFEVGAGILESNHHYDRNLALARLGILPFFWIASAVVYVWAHRELGGLAALLATFLFTFLPPVLAHAGLATTDMGLTAFVGASFLTAIVWAEKPTWRRSLIFGVATGLAVLSKFSSLAFIPASIAMALAWYLANERPGVSTWLAQARVRILPFCLAVAAGALLIWAGYFFSYGQLRAGSRTLSLPAPALFAGIMNVAAHNAEGHHAYLLGEARSSGWWYFFPVVLAVKTPLPFLSLLFFGAWRFVRHPKQTPRGVPLALMFSLGILLFSMTSQINIGVRHILPVYMGFSLIAAFGAEHLLEMARSSRWALGSVLALLAWSAATSLAGHPDYLPYFNALAGSQPEKILVDSDLDWGQDMKRLGERLREVHAKEIAFVPLVETAARGFPPLRYGYVAAPSPGWNAVSLTVLKEYPDKQTWPEYIPPAERIGKGILLYYFAPK